MLENKKNSIVAKNRFAVGVATRHALPARVPGVHFEWQRVARAAWERVAALMHGCTHR